MTERTKLLLRENKIMRQTASLYTKLNKFLKDDDDVTQILYAIYMEEGQTQKQIADGYGIPPQTVKKNQIYRKGPGIFQRKNRNNFKS